MGISTINCKCIKSCKDSPNEVDLANGDYLRSKSSNSRINNNPLHFGHYNKSRTQSFLFNSKISNFKISSELDNNNPKEKIKETVPPTIFEDSEENKYLETNNYPIKTVESLNLNNNIKLNTENNSNNDHFEKNEINQDDYNDDENNMVSQKALIKIIPNFDKTFFFTKQIKNAEKNFSKPLDYEKDIQKYIKDDDENKDIVILINNLKKNKGINHTNEDGIVFEYNGEKYLYFGEIDRNLYPMGLGIIYTKQKRYEGYFDKGKILGLGRYIDQDGICYEGLFEGNKLISKATVIKRNENNNKIEYFGDLVNFKKNGKGEEICENEYKYTGDFVDDMWQGKGQLENLQTGDIYEGQFNKGKMTGKGIFKWKNGEIYKGDFVQGIKHGTGIHKWPDGSQYEGEYNNGIREGKAKYKWADGRIFEGMFKNGKPDGKGKISYNGKTIKCEFKDGKQISDISNLFENS